VTRRDQDFQTIRSEGGLLPSDLLRRVLDSRAKLDGTRPEDYGLPQSERLNEVITQSWNRLRKHWAEFRAAAASLPESEAGTGLTNDKWSLPLLRELGFGLLPTSAGPEVGGRSYAISRFFGPVPVHLVGCGLSLDRRAAGQRGAAAANPHGLVQDFLNRSPAHVWGIVSDGLRFRMLRDNQALSRQSFLEFDLESMFAGEVYSDFVLLWLIAHATRFAPREGERPETCWLEHWTKQAEEQGTRALGDLRGGVERALQILGEGFTSHPKNTTLRDGLRTGELPLTDFHGQLMRVVYRLIFLFVAEDRTLDGQPLLHPREDSEAARIARERFAAHYSTARLREMAGQIKGSRHDDLWQQFQLLVGALSGDEAFASVREHLALPALGSVLWSPVSTAALNDVELTNHDVLEALRHLAFTRQGKVLRPVDYRNLGAEELGGVYESLLALTPQISTDGARFSFAEFAGNERKTSGSYYTPDSLVQCLLDSALDPVVEEAIRGKSGAEAEKAILAIKVCDPAVGSGHFLVGAAHRLARHLARVRALAAGESEPSPLLYQHALRDVIGRCLYGVDVNPMAAELCRVSLWLEALEPGKPLSFLDHHIRVGNSLLGATPELVAAGLPDDAFAAIEGDEKKVCSSLKRRNKQEREGQRDMVHLMAAEAPAEYNSIEARARSLDEAPGDTLDQIQHKAEQFRGLVVSPEYQHAQQILDTWCAAFVWKKQTGVSLEPITTDTLRLLETDPKALTVGQRSEVERLSRQYQFFHWQLAFPKVLAEGGFNCVLGNPPWERVKLQEKEWFAKYRPEIADAANAAARKRLIEALEIEDPGLYQRFLDDSRRAEGESHLLRNSGRYPLCGRGDINLYTVFAECMRSALSANGRVGVILPSGLATDDTTKHFFGDVMRKQVLVSFTEFENEGFFMGAGQGHMLRFALTTIGGTSTKVGKTDFAFQLKAISELSNPEFHFTLSKEDMALFSPNTGSCPIFRRRRDAELNKHIYRSVPVLVREGMPGLDPWKMQFCSMFHMANDSSLFVTLKQLSEERWAAAGATYRKGTDVCVPLIEAKSIHQFNHRHGDFCDAESGKRAHILPEVPSERLENPDYSATPFYWISRTEVGDALRGLWKHDWLLGWRRVTDSRASARTFVACVFPRYGAGDSIFLACPAAASPFESAGLLGNLNAFVFDYTVRQKLGGINLLFFVVRQLPVMPPTAFAQRAAWAGGREIVSDWLLPRVLELTYVAWDLAAFAQDCSWSGPPFRWDEERRFLLRCELDAAFFHFYLPAEKSGDWCRAEGETAEDLVRLKASFATPRDAVACIMDTFPIVRRKDEEKYAGDYRTKRVILDIYDAMLESIRTGQPYQTCLDPPPADPRCCHPPREDGQA
jgi:hypothetical protein